MYEAGQLPCDRAVIEFFEVNFQTETSMIINGYARSVWHHNIFSATAIQDAAKEIVIAAVTTEPVKSVLEGRAV
jgi:hypothetical protein